ncbi:MAG TPA: hypothetical protein VIT20_05410 [Propionibacteriaceae bacterium]
MTTHPSRSARVLARERGIRAVRRTTIAVALTAAATVSGVAGLLAADWSNAATVTSSDTTASESSTGTSDNDDWGTSTTPEQSSGGSSHTSSGGS